MKFKLFKEKRSEAQKVRDFPPNLFSESASEFFCYFFICLVIAILIPLGLGFMNYKLDSIDKNIAKIAQYTQDTDKLMKQ